MGGTIDMTSFYKSGELTLKTVCIAGICLWTRNPACFHASMCLGVLTYEMGTIICPKVLVFLSLVTII